MLSKTSSIVSSVTTSPLRFLVYFHCFDSVVFNFFGSTTVMILDVHVSQSPPFWVMLRAVKEFVQNEGNGSLPVRGAIPDMIADSQKFINLQNV